MNKEKEIVMPCHHDPHNFGLHCPNQGVINGVKEAECEHCGWNPVVAKKRHEETLNKCLFKIV